MVDPHGCLETLSFYFSSVDIDTNTKYRGEFDEKS